MFCGSSQGNDPQFVGSAVELGVALAHENLGLVYGGGSLGLMGVIARAAIAADGHVVGIIPTSLCGREKPPADLHELVITTSMHARKQAMFDRSSAFVALPGGLGTLDETVEQMTWMKIGHHRKPIVFLNVAGYWDPVLTMFDKMLACHFLAPDVGIEVVRHAAEVIPAIKEYWDCETRDCVGIAPAMGAMTEEAVGGSDELRTEAAPGIPVWTGLGLE
ncbi:MAG: TIGR00730 family Rossman fold protein [Rhodoplanes sp.]